MKNGAVRPPDSLGRYSEAKKAGVTHLKTHRPRTLHLSLKREYFEAIRDGRKSEEFRLCTPYWSKRLEGREYDQVVLTLGYPARNDHARRLVRSWRGFTVKTITHSHFGQDPVLVYAISVDDQ